MNKKDLTAKLAKQTGLTLSQAKECIDVVFNSITENIVDGNSTTIQGFGSFTVSSRAERQGVNPSTKKTIIIPARKVMKFKPSKSISINN